MALDPLFLTLASVTILTPGPSVLLTLTNAIEGGFRNAVGGILGMAFGNVVVASVSASGLGVLLVTSPATFRAMKLAGALYLVALGIRSWLARPAAGVAPAAPPSRITERRFFQGLALQLTNPQAIVFFLALLPQFVDASREQVPQYASLVLVFGTLMIAIHAAYAAVASRARSLVAAPRSARLIRQIAGACFVVFAVTLALR